MTPSQTRHLQEGTTRIRDLDRLRTELGKDVSARIAEAQAAWGGSRFVRPSRLERALDYLISHGLLPNQVTIEEHYDPLWSARQIREPKEKLAGDIGHTNVGLRNKVASRWWIVPTNVRTGRRLVA